MKDTTTTTFGTTVTPATSPMNLTCTTVSTSGGSAPSLLQIVINPTGHAKDPDPGWSTYIAPDPAREYDLHDVGSGKTFKVGGAGVAIYFKD